MGFLFIAIAAMFNAVMDTLSHHYYISIFHGRKFTLFGKVYDQRFFNPSISWEHVDYVHLWFIQTRYRADAWHLAKSGMLLFLICAAVGGCLIDLPFLPIWANGLLSIGVAGTEWILVFNLFYNKVLRK